MPFTLDLKTPTQDSKTTMGCNEKNSGDGFGDISIIVCFDYHLNCILYQNWLQSKSRRGRDETF